MTDGIEAVTTAMLGLALDAASLRQRAIAANIANHSTEGYVPVKVDFDSQMEEARRSLESQGTVDAAALSDVRLEIQPAFNANGQPQEVQLDAQIADMAQNAGQFQTLTRVLSRHFSILSSAVSDGRR